MCDCSPLAGNSSPTGCYLGGCYCNREEAAAEARQNGLLVRCGGGLPCACAIAVESPPPSDPLETAPARLDAPPHPHGDDADVMSTHVLGALQEPDPMASTVLPPPPRPRKGCCGSGGGGVALRAAGSGILDEADGGGAADAADAADAQTSSMGEGAGKLLPPEADLRQEQPLMQSMLPLESHLYAQLVHQQMPLHSVAGGAGGQSGQQRNSQPVGPKLLSKVNYGLDSALLATSAVDGIHSLEQGIAEEPRVKCSRCQCGGEGDGLCMCGTNCACLTPDVEFASRTMVELSAACSAVQESTCCGQRNHAPSVIPQQHAPSASLKQELLLNGVEPHVRQDAMNHANVVGDLTQRLHSAPPSQAISGDNSFSLPSRAPAGSKARHAFTNLSSTRGEKRPAPSSAKAVNSRCASGCPTRSKSSGSTQATCTGSTPMKRARSPQQKRSGGSRNPNAARPYSCPHESCGATFVFKQNRDRHLVEVHQPERRPFLCKKKGCSAAFKNSSGLKQHESTVHQKNRPFKCDDCDASFGQRNHLTQHVQAVHLGNRPFSCPICPAKFSNRGNLNQHMRRRAHMPPDGEGALGVAATARGPAKQTTN